MSNRFVKVPIYPRFFRVDLDEVEAYVARRYQETFGELPPGVEVEKYPGEIDIVVYVVYAVNPSSLLNSMTKRITLKE